MASNNASLMMSMATATSIYANLGDVTHHLGRDLFPNDSTIFFSYAHSGIKSSWIRRWDVSLSSRQNVQSFGKSSSRDLVMVKRCFFVCCSLFSQLSWWSPSQWRCQIRRQHQDQRLDPTLSSSMLCPTPTPPTTESLLMRFITDFGWWGNNVGCTT